MRNTSLRTLIGQMKMMGKNPDLANRSFSEFLRRLGPKLIGLCRTMCYRSVSTKNRQAVEDLFQDTLERFFKGVDRFDENKYPDEKSLEFGLIKWFLTRTQWSYSDMIKAIIKQSKYSELSVRNHFDQLRNIGRGYDEQDESLLLIKEFGKKGINIKADQYIQILEQLPVRERDILMTYMRYSPGLPPRSEVRMLAQVYGIKINSVRAIKMRALVKVQKAVLDLSKKPAKL
jgi:RNA polymerase sigma factor (sigma-70 family)